MIKKTLATRMENRGGRKMIYALISMVVPAVLLSILTFVPWKAGSDILLLGWLFSRVLWRINIIAIICFVVIAFVLKVDRVPRAILYTLLATAVVFALVILLHPLMKPAALIRADMLRRTPIGTSMEEVVGIVEKNVERKGWNVYYNGVNDRGYVHPDTSEVIGTQSIDVYLGSYREFWEVGVSAYWAFDDDGKLIDVYVGKTANSL